MAAKVGRSALRSVQHDAGLHLVEGVLDVFVLPGSYLRVARTLDGHGIATDTAEPGSLALGISIQLHQITARECLALAVLWHHLLDIDPMGIHRELVGELVVSTILAIEDDIHRLAPWNVGEAHTPPHLKGHYVAHQRLVGIVVDECPLLAFGRRLERRALEDAAGEVELDSVRLLRMAHAGISPEAGSACLPLYPGAVIIDEVYLRLQVVLLVVGIDSPCGVDADGRQIGELIVTRAVALACVTVESQFGYVAAGIMRPHVTHIAKTTAHADRSG